MKKLIFCLLSLLAHVVFGQQTVNNFSVKSNLTVSGSAYLNAPVLTNGTAVALTGSLTNVTLNGTNLQSTLDGKMPIINSSLFGVTGVVTDQLPPYWTKTTFSDSIGTGDFTMAASFRAPEWTEFEQGLVRCKSATSLNRLFQLSITADLISINLMSTAATNDATAGLVTSAGLWTAANTIVAGTTNTLAVVRSGTNLTVYLNGATVSGSYVNQQAFGEAMIDGASNVMEAGQAWRPDQYNNELWFGERIFWAKAWASAVTSDWENAASPIASTTMDETELVDQSGNLQDALDYAGANGGGTVLLPLGTVRIDSGLIIPAGVSLRGQGGANYTQGRAPTDAVTGANSILFPWYGFRTNVIQMTDATAFTNTTKVLNNVTSSDLSYYTSYLQNSVLEDFGVDATAVIGGNTVYSKAVAGWKARRLTIRGGGHPFFVVAANAVQIEDMDAIGKLGGIFFNYSADCDIGPNILWGSTRGASIWLVNANKNRIKGNHIFNALQPRQNAVSVNASTDEFTLAAHGFITGDPIVFVAESGSTLPAPLDARVHYWITRTGPDTFTVNQQRDQGAVGGAMQGVALDITDTGSGTYWAYPGQPSDLMIHGSDQNQIVDNTFDQAAQDAVTLYNADRSTIVGNMLTEYGYNSSTRTNAAAVRFLYGSDTNYVGGNMVGRRLTSTSFGQHGFIFESGSDGNIIGGQSMQPLPIPFVMPNSDNVISTELLRQIYGDNLFGTKALATNATSGFFVMPRTGGQPTGAPANASTVDGVFTTWNSSGTELNGYANGYWSRIPGSAADGRWTFANTSNGIPSVQVSTTESQEVMRIANDSATGSYGPSIGFRRTNGTNAVGAAWNLMELQASGWNGSDFNYNVANIYASTEESFTPSAGGTKLIFQTTAVGSTSPATSLQIYGSGQIQYLSRSSSPAIFREGSLYYRTDTDQFRIQTGSSTDTPLVSYSGLAPADNSVLRADGTGGAKAQASALIVDDYTSSTANNVALRVDDGTTADIAAVITPKGNGAFIVGPKPDGVATVGGNARGTSAVDLVTSRVLATEVASGNYTFNAGFRGTASSTYAANIGAISISSGFASLSTGYGTGASGNYSTTLGTFSSATRNGQVALAGGRFSTTGDAQSSTVVLRNSTSSTTPTVLFLDGSSARLTITAHSTCTFSAVVTGRTATGTLNSYGYKIDGVIERGSAAATTAIVGTPVVTVLAEDSAAADATATADTTNGALSITVTAADSTATRWMATVQMNELTYP